ncbi:MAG: 16S rRNA (uracil(1498)-N(3))-methyltransferase [Lachnospiraceae bacterium]|nr:16S rRNA (uracil(1498)-N(3))-methyltransferase [Lachnospiraceae bacterium]
MYRFFVEEDHINGKEIYIDGSDLNHMKNVLRIKPGEEISVQVPSEDREYRCSLKTYEDDRAILTLLFIKEENVELPGRIYLFQGLPKGDKMELIIQKAVELGVYEIIPVSMKRSVVKLDEKKKAARVLRYNAISEAAAKQAKRGIIPKITNVMSFGEALEYSKDIDVRLLPYELHDSSTFEDTRSILGSIKKGESIGIFIGPEGGFDDEEITLAREAGYREITLGKRILRTETAGMTVLSWLVYLLEG